MLAESTKQRFAAEHTHIEVIVSRLHPLVEALCHQRLTLVRHHTPVKWNALLSLRTAGIDARFAVEIAVIDSLTDIVCQTSVAFCIGRFTEQTGCIGQYAGIGIEIYAGGEFLVAAHSHRHPVAPAPVCEMLGEAVIHVIHVASDVLVAVTQRLVIAIEQVERPRYDGNGTGPVESVIRAVAPTACGYDVGQNAVGLLFVPMILHPLLVYGDAVIVVESGLYSKMSVAGPAVLLALRAVGGQPHEVGQIRHTACMHQFAYDGVRSRYAAHLRYIAVQEAGREVVRGKFNGVRTLHLHVAEAFIVELRAIFIGFTAQSDHIGLEGITLPVTPIIHVDVGLVDGSILAQALCMTQVQYSSALTL